jgi:hypothetical protein
MLDIFLYLVGACSIRDTHDVEVDLVGDLGLSVVRKNDEYCKQQHRIMVGFGTIKILPTTSIITAIDVAHHPISKA